MTFPGTYEQSLIERHIAEHGVRRFEMGARSDPHALREYLAERGYQVSFNATRTVVMVKKIGTRGRARRMNMRSFYALVDDVRQSEGLETLKRPVKGVGTFKSLGEALRGAFE